MLTNMLFVIRKSCYLDFMLVKANLDCQIEHLGNSCNSNIAEPFGS